VRPLPSHAPSDAERAELVRVANEPRFVALPSARIVPMLAGATVTPSTLARAQAQGLKAQEFLDRNDACHFFAPLADLVVPWPTFTNVNDFRAVLVV
jgi:hypothetical protein